MDIHRATATLAHSGNSQWVSLSDHSFKSIDTVKSFTHHTMAAKETQGVALTGRNRTGLPCSVDRPAAGLRSHAPGSRPDRTPVALQTTTEASQQNNTGPLGGPVMKEQTNDRKNLTKPLYV